MTLFRAFTIGEGQRESFVMTYGPSHRRAPAPMDADAALRHAEAWWNAWAGRCSHEGRRRDAVIRSLLTLKALTIGRAQSELQSLMRISYAVFCLQKKHQQQQLRIP